MEDLSAAAILTLAALDRGVAIVPFADGSVAVELDDGALHDVPADHLADLVARALVRVADESDHRGLPLSITVTEWGRTFLRRWLLANNIRVVSKKRR